MGRFLYDATTNADFDDRLLAHLQVVIGAKMRRGESFYFTWSDDPAIGDGRTTVWIAPTIPLKYRYSGAVPPELNRAWIELLMLTANSTGGLRALPEPTEEPSRSGGDVLV